MVSIIIPTFNHLDLTIQCLEAIRHQTEPGTYEVIVVDNGSTDGTQDYLSRESSQGRLCVLLNPQNLGFAIACNQGARLATGDFVLFLNNDTIPQTGWLEALVRMAEADPTIGIVGSKLLFADGTIQHAGVVVGLRNAEPAPYHIYLSQPADAPFVNRPREFQMVTGACLMVRRVLLETIGGFDEGFWNGHEDLDLCLRARQLGKKVMYCPQSVVTHLESRTKRLIGLSNYQYQKGLDNEEGRGRRRFLERWSGTLQIDERLHYAEDGVLGTLEAEIVRLEGQDPVAASVRPTLSLCMIVKDEEPFLAGCLESVRDVVDEMIVVDTGSTDRTIAIAESFGAQVHRFAWTGDFAAARNASLSHATGDWILVLDADERLEARAPEAWSLLLADPDAVGYALQLEDRIGAEEDHAAQMTTVFRLFRNRPDVRFEGMIHEQAIRSANRTGLRTRLCEFKIVHLGNLAHWRAVRDKRNRNLDILERQLRLEPSDPYVHFNLGEVLKLSDRFEEAEKHYRSALALLKDRRASHATPYYASLYFSLADLYRQTKRHDEAREVLTEALTHYPTFPDLHYTLGYVLLDQGDPRAAIASFECCQELQGLTHPYATDPAVPGHKSSRAIADSYAQLGDKARARAYFARALSQMPRPDAEVLANLGILSLDDEPTQALKYFEAAVAQDPEHLVAWMNLGMLYLARGAYPAARGAWHRCVVLGAHISDAQTFSELAAALETGRWPAHWMNNRQVAVVIEQMVSFVLETGRAESLQPLLDRLDEWGAILPELEYLLGRCFLRHGHPDLALAVLLRAQQRTPEVAEVYTALGTTCQALNHVADAETMFARAAELSPSHDHQSNNSS